MSHWAPNGTSNKQLSQNYQPIEDEGRGEHHQRLIVLGFLLPPDAEFAHIVEPGNRPLDFPAARRLDWFSNPRPVILTMTFGAALGPIGRIGTGRSAT